MKNKRTYIMLLLLMIAGYVWVYLNFNNHAPSFGCLFKYITNIPCPSCGTTRAVLSIISGDLGAGLKYNPLGYFYLIAMILVPIFMIIDFVFQKNSIIKAYDIFILNLSNKKISIPFFSIILLNWGWNIIKML